VVKGTHATRSAREAAMSENCRNQFEVWAAKKGMAVSKHPTGHNFAGQYTTIQTTYAWRGWLACSKQNEKEQTKRGQTNE